MHMRSNKLTLDAAQNGLSFEIDSRLLRSPVANRLYLLLSNGYTIKLELKFRYSQICLVTRVVLLLDGIGTLAQLTSCVHECVDISLFAWFH